MTFTLPIFRLALALTVVCTTLFGGVACLPSTKSSSLASRASTACNGDASLCDRLYSNVTYVGAHNSYAIGSVSQASLGYNQQGSVTTQLNDGIRLLQIQVHTSTNSSTTGSGLNLCHSSCSIVDGGSLESYLSEVHTWLTNNANDVVTILMVNSDDQAVSKFDTAFQSTNLASMAYAPSSGALAKSAWPTLSQMIAGNERLVVFIDNSADTSSVPYILPEFQNMWENPYDQTSTPFNCSVDRINQGSTASNLMYLINHNLDTSFDLFGTSITVPNTNQLNTTNSLDSVLTDANNCASMHSSMYPTFILADFYNTGAQGLFRAAARMNDITYVSTSSSNSSSSSSSGSGSGTTSSATSFATMPAAAWLASSAAIVALTSLLT